MHECRLALHLAFFVAARAAGLSECPMRPYRSTMVYATNEPIGWLCDSGSFETAGCVCQMCFTWICAIGQYYTQCATKSDGFCTECPPLVTHVLFL